MRRCPPTVQDARSPSATGATWSGPACAVWPTRLKGIPITPRTIFDAGSVAKQFTAAAILLLAQRHRLDLADTLADHLDGFPAWADTVTLDQLMHHVSGIPEFIYLFDVKGYLRTDYVTQQLSWTSYARCRHWTSLREITSSTPTPTTSCWPKSSRRFPAPISPRICAGTSSNPCT